MKVGSCISKKGKMKSGQLKLARYKGKDIKIPVHIIEGKKEGKTVFISGGIHGDEINGIQLVQKFMHSLDPKEIIGRIIFLPILNISGFRNNTRHVSYDRKDLNRSFVKGNSVSNKMAKTIFDEVIARCDFGIDCHSGHEFVLIPHVRAHIGKDNVCSDGCTLDMAAVFGSKIILKRKGITGMIAIEAFKKLKTPVLTVEIGGNTIIRNNYIKEGSKGIRNILINKGFLKGRIKKPKEQYVISDISRHSYLAKINGVLNMNYNLGEDVHLGDEIAHIHDPIKEETQKLKSKECGFIFSTRMQN